MSHNRNPSGKNQHNPVCKSLVRYVHPNFTEPLGDGHDKLYKIGFPIWAVVDDATGTWLGAWAVPSNRMGEIIGYLYLCLVEKYRGE
jgi:hypothetical protein